MHAPKLLLTAAWAASQAFTVAAQDQVVLETPEFDVAEALLQYNVALSDLPGLSGISNETAETGCPIACDALKFLYGDEAVETRDETAYAEFVGSYWSANQAAVKPYCVFKPEKPEGVSVMILLSRLTQCPFAAKSGGHAAMAGASGSDGGITLSFVNMKDIKLSDDKQIASVQPGNIWGDVFAFLTKFDVTVIGGRLFNIGVGGLTTGGGISYFSNQHGWACDNVESYDVVTATGAIVRASATEHGDLFWALRGGGNNFGLVVNFNLKTIPLEGGKMWGGARTYMPDHFDEVAAAFHNLIVNSEDDTKAGMWHVYGHYNKTSFAIPTLYYAEPNGGEAAIWNDFNAIPAAVDATQDRIVAEFAAEGMTQSPPGLREVYYVISTKADLELQKFARDLYFEDVVAVSDIPGIVPMMPLQGITVPQLKKMQENGGNALGLEVEDGPLYIIQLSIWWYREEDDEAVYSFASNLLRKISDEAKRRGLYNDYLYMNYASQYQDVVASYGEENKARLKSISEKYDPKQVFQKLQPGYFKLDRAPIPDSEYFSF
ncbi:FAD binding domain-containing protein [Colletotrichum sojae]|uniref:FAD binding domain-containing protein n=1 Tax=Colletotrichum sojae TaxID=2175907 RepID=A0A8H6JQ51_9PEZI|nr:FAD binding domain-containing protein [Colletotrichum sojae]